MSRRLTAALLVGLTAAAAAGSVAPTASAVTLPGRITSVTSGPGPSPGQVTIRWAASASATSGFVIETGLTSFGSAGLPAHGRGWKTFTVSGARRSVTLTAAQVASAGAPLGSANHLYFRLRAIHRTSSITAVRSYPYLQSVGVAPMAPATVGTPLRIASFNIRSAKAGGPSWLSRAPRVAAAILAKGPTVVTLQELSPGRADGGSGSTTGSVRQTDSLERALAAQGGGRYQLVRTTSYIPFGVAHGTQGARILYDTHRLSLVSRCSDRTGTRNYSTSCSFDVPMLPGDAASTRRSAAWATFADRRTGAQFVVVSAHLDSRHSGNAATEQRFDLLRSSQMKTILARVAAVNPRHLPVVFGGDINSWQNNKVGYRAHDRLVSAGFFDMSAARRTVNLRYTTLNDFTTTMRVNASGWGARLDVLAVQGVRGASKFENVMKVVDGARASDHNLIYADIRLPR